MPDKSAWADASQRAIQNLVMRPEYVELARRRVERGETAKPRFPKVPTADPVRQPKTFARELEAHLQIAWDYRLGVHQRWEAAHQDFSRETIVEMSQLARAIGMVGQTEPQHDHYDIAFVAGAGGEIALRRTQHVTDAVGITGEQLTEVDHVISAGSQRILPPGSQKDVRNFGGIETFDLDDGRITEFDAMLFSQVATLGVTAAEYERFEPGLLRNPRLQWNIRQLQTEVTGIKSATVIGAPTSSMDRGQGWANTPDTYNMLMAMHAVPDGARVLLSTNAIYVPFQSMDALRTLGARANADIDAIGYASESKMTTMSPEDYADYVTSLPAMTSEERDAFARGIKPEDPAKQERADNMQTVRNVGQEILSAVKSGRQLAQEVSRQTGERVL